MGPSGSGKTTAYAHRCGIDRPERGMPVCVDGEHLWVLYRRVTGWPNCDGAASATSSSDGTFSTRSPWSRTWPCPRARRHRIPRGHRDAMAALEDVGIAELARQFQPSLSGGERQREEAPRRWSGPSRPGHRGRADRSARRPARAVMRLRSAGARQRHRRAPPTTRPWPGGPTGSCTCGKISCRTAHQRAAR